MRYILVVLMSLVLSSGCANQLNDDWLALNQTQGAIVSKMLEFERAHMELMKGSIEKTFKLYENEIKRREEAQFLDPRTVVVDGVERIMVQGPNGDPVAISREDLEKFVDGAIEARALLAVKKAEWNRVFSNWEQLLADVAQSNEVTLQTAKDIHEALESAQKVLDDVTSVVASLTAATAAAFLAG